MTMILAALLASTTLGAPVEKVARHPALFGKLSSLVANASTAPASFRHIAFDELNEAASKLQSGQCADLPPQILSGITGGAIPDCRTFVGILTSAGVTCTMDLGHYIPEATGHTAAELCCATCAAGGGSDPVTHTCDAVKAACVADLQSISNAQGTGKCDSGTAACDKLDPSDPAADAACIGCVERVFGADYRPCSCCIRPILEEMGVDIDQDTQAAINMIFPCTD